MKKLLFSLILVLVLALGGCSKEEQPNTDQPNNDQSEVNTEDAILLGTKVSSYALSVKLGANLNLYLDEAGTIIGVERLNDDAKTISNGDTVLNNSIKDGLKTLIDTSVTSGYLISGSTIEILSQSGKIDYTTRSYIIDVVYQSLQKLVKNHSYEIKVSLKMNDETLLDGTYSPKTSLFKYTADYDLQNQLVKETWTYETNEVYTYSYKSNVLTTIEVQQSDGSKVVRSFDVAGKLTLESTTFKDGHSEDKYYKNGVLTRILVKQTDGTYSDQTVDSNGHVVQEKQYDESDRLLRSVTYTYTLSNDGKIMNSKEEYSDGGSVEKFYDENGLLIEEINLSSYGDENKNEFQYDENGVMIRKDYYQADGAFGFELYKNRVITINDFTFADGCRIVTHYDASGNETTVEYYDENGKLYTNADDWYNRYNY